LEVEMTNNILTTLPSYGNVKNKDEIINTLAILTSSISHDLKNDLATIKLCAESALITIKKRADKANNFLDTMRLQIESVVAGTPSGSDFKTCSIANNIDEVLKQYPFQDNERHLVIANLTNDFEYIGDHILTNHILSNLIKNSLRAIKNASKGEIIISLKYGDKFNKLTFRDTGLGIPKDFLPKVFELFASQSTSQGGTGVGLAYCAQIMQSYGGKISCESTEGEYTEFALEFPLV